MERALRGGSVGARTTILYRMLVAAGELAALPASERPNCLLAYLHRYLRVFDTSHAAVAERYATAAIAADDHKAAAFVTLAVIYDKAQHPLDSLKAAQKGIAADPGHAPAYDRAAIAASRWSNLLLDYQMSRAAFETEPRNPYYLAHLEHLLLTQLEDPSAMANLMRGVLAGDLSNEPVRAALSRSVAILARPRTPPRPLRVSADQR